MNINGGVNETLGSVILKLPELISLNSKKYFFKKKTTNLLNNKSKQLITETHETSG